MLNGANPLPLPISNDEEEEEEIVIVSKKRVGMDPTVFFFLIFYLAV